MATLASSDNWLRVNLAGEICLKEALQAVLHNDQKNTSYTGLTRNGVQLHQEMSIFKNSTKGQELKRKKVIQDFQWDIMCPNSGISCSDDWDIPNIKVAIQYKTNLQAPIGGWKIVTPELLDISKSAYVCRAKELRNKLKHGSIKEMIDVSKYNDMLSEIQYVLHGLDYKNIQIFENIKNKSLEEYTEKILKILEDDIENARTYFENKITDVKDGVKDVRNVAALNTLKMDKHQEHLDELQHLVNLIQIKEKKSSEKSQQKHKEMESRVSKVEKAIEQSVPKDVVLLDCLKIVSEEIGDKWKTLATILKLPLEGTAEDSTVDKKIMTCFCNCGYSVSWSLLKRALMQLNEENLIERLKDETNLTTEIDGALKLHRQEILRKYEYQQVLNPFINSSDEKYETRHHSDIFVDLAIIEGSVYSSNYTDPEKYSDTEYFIRQSVLQEHNNINIEDLVCTEDKYVVVSGIPGIGKSKLVDNIIWKWASNQLFNGNDGMPNVQLLLPIKCREVNDLRGSDDVESMIKQYYPKLFRNIELSNLNDISHKIMFIVDGLDELVSVEEINKPSRCRNEHSQKILQFVRDLILSKNKVFPDQYTIVVGRPKIADFVQKKIEKHTQIKKMQVCGFSVENVEKYVQKHCNADELILKVKLEISNNTIMESMSHVPVYLWVICNIYKDDISIKTPRTSTELMLYACLVFIRNHFRDSEIDVSDLTLIELCENDDVLKLITSIAKLSFTALKDNKIMFENAELHSIISDVDELEKKTGLIVKCSNESVITYQFTHLVLHELFAALHIFLSNELQPRICCSGGTDVLGYQEIYVSQKHSTSGDVEKKCNVCGAKIDDFSHFDYDHDTVIDEKRFFTHIDNTCEYMTNLSYCYPIIAGLEGLFTTKGPLGILLQSLSKFTNSNPSQTSLMLLKSYYVLLGYGSLSSIEFVTDLNCSISDSLDDYIKCWYECHNEIPRHLADLLIKKPTKFVIRDRLLLIAQHSFVVKLKSNHHDFHLTHIQVEIDPQTLSKVEVDCLVELLNCCQYHCYQHLWATMCYPKLMKLQVGGTCIETFIISLVRYRLNQNQLHVLMNINHLCLTNFNGVNVEENLVVLLSHFKAVNCHFKKISFKNFHLNDDPIDVKIKMYIPPILYFSSELEVEASKCGMEALGMSNLCSFIEKDLHSKLQKITMNLEDALKLTDYTNIIHCLKHVQEVIIKLFLLEPVRLHVFFSGCGDFLQSWMALSETLQGKLTFIVPYVDICDDKFIERFNKKFQPLFSIKYEKLPNIY